jgi:ribonuclease HI
VCPDLQDSALPNSKLVWYTDGSTFVSDGVRKSGAVVVDQGGNIIWSAPLPPGTSAQKAELIALAEALEQAKGKQVTVYTDSRYAFGTVHVHGTIYRERGFITVEGKELRNLPEIQRLLMAVQKPQAVAVVHIPGHQSSQTPEAMGNQRADEVA